MRMDFRCTNRGFLQKARITSRYIFGMEFSMRIREEREKVPAENSYKFIRKQTLAAEMYQYSRTRILKRDNIGTAKTKMDFHCTECIVRYVRITGCFLR